MCGILGLFPGSKFEAEKGLRMMAHRGMDNTTVLEIGSGVVGHVLHALVGTVRQPVKGEGMLLFNGEIYNWVELAKEEGIGCANDTELLLHLLDKYDIDDIREKLDGVYAFAFIKNKVITIERDILGVKPLWYSTENGFSFASEKKALLELGLSPMELHPRTTLRYYLNYKKLESSVREFSFKETERQLNDVIVDSVKKRLPFSKKVGVLFSGGIDSSLIAMLARDLGAKVTLYVAALDDPEKQTPHDLEAAREAAKKLDLPLKEIIVPLAQVDEDVAQVADLIEDSNVVKIGVALPLWYCCREAAKDGQRVVLSGLGAEEVFAGYQRHTKAIDINKECLRGLRMMHERDLYRDDIVGMSNTIEIRLPFLDLELVSAGLSIPGWQKINAELGKIPLREAAIELGLDNGIANRPKKAAQYGSGFDAAIGKLAKKKGMTKSEYLRTNYPVNAKLAALLSTGKDSVYALYKMQQMNYEISCLVNVQAKNPHSYMYHTPLVNFASLQADALGIPILIEKTEGEKEEELEALKDALTIAKEKYRIEGVVSGALFSDYQRSRIEKICEELGLRVYSPLWHIDQEQEMREILDAGFTFIMSRVAADGLDKSWVGRAITHEDVDKLSKKMHLNVAGEGGEFETLVLDGPNFNSRIVIENSSVKCEDMVCELEAEGSLLEK